MIFFTADEHYGHENIIKYCNRPFQNVSEMDAELIRRHNEMVCQSDTVIHAGDFTLKNRTMANEYIKQLNGHHTFLKGSHDYWIEHNDARKILEMKINGRYIVICHYALRVWPRSHYNSWMLFGHSHGTLPPIGKQWDIGVDNNNFYPVSFDRIEEIMNNQPDNPNLIKERNRHK